MILIDYLSPGRSLGYFLWREMHIILASDYYLVYHYDLLISLVH